MSWHSVGDRPVDPYAWHYRPKPAALLHYHKRRRMTVVQAARQQMRISAIVLSLSTLLTLIFL